MRFSIKSLLVFVGVAAVITVAGVTGYRFLFGNSGYQASSDTANLAFSSRLILPPSATDVNYYADGCIIEADFAISEEAFLRWCEQQTWMPVEIGPKGGMFDHARSSPNVDNGPQFVSKGYQIDTPAGYVTYDADAGRVSIWHYDC